MSSFEPSPSSSSPPRLPQNAADLRCAVVRDGHARGWSFVPMIGKRPKEKGWNARGREDVQTALAWAKEGNIGIRTGAHSGGLVVLDDDSPEQAGESVLKLPKTVTAITGTGKRHFYFRCAQPLRNSVGKLAPGVDVRADGGVIVAAGSVHPDTRQLYRYAGGCSPKDVEIAELPEAIVAALVQSRTSPKTPRRIRDPVAYARKALENAEAELRTAPEGTRNDTLFRVTAGMRPLIGMGSIARDEVVDQLTAATDLPPGEIEGTLRSALKEKLPPTAVSEPRRAMLTNLTEVGLAEWIVAERREAVCYCESTRKFLIWDGQRWKVDEACMRVDGLIIESLKNLHSAARKIEADLGREKLVKFLKDAECRARITAVRKLMPSVGIRVLSACELDADAWLLNTVNGVVDLRTGNLLPHDPSKLMTKLAPVEYNPGAKCPRFERFLLEILDGDVEAIEFLKRWFGHCATGDISVQLLPVFIGEGANGKTTLLEAVRGTLGSDYVTDAPASLMSISSRQEHPTELAALQSVRLAIGSETERDSRIRAALIKRLTGDQFIKARRMRTDYFEFLRTSKPVLVTNTTPVIDDPSEGMWRRVCLVRFPVIIPAAKRDSRLLDALLAEREGILAWIVRGCLDWQAHGIYIPKSMAAETRMYRDTSDPVRAFVSRWCEHDPRARTGSSEMYEAFSSSSPTSISVHQFVKEFNRVTEQFGWNVCAARFDGRRGWTGVKLRPSLPM